MVTESVLAKYVMICSSIAVLIVVYNVVLLTVFCSVCEEKQVRPNRVKSSEGGKRERDVALSQKDHHHDHDC